MKYALFFGFFVSVFTFLPIQTFAHQPKMVEGINTQVAEPTVSKAFYGTLSGEPHVYQINSANSFELYVNVLVPDTAGQKKDISAVVIKKSDTENPLVILDGVNFEWKKFFEPFGRDTYWQGPEFKSQVEAGSYEVRVWSSNNDSKYSLAIGEKEAFSFMDGYNAVRLIPILKKDFFNKSPAGFALSPFGIGYIFIMYLIAFVFGFIYRGVIQYMRNKRQTDSSLIKPVKNIGKYDRVLRLVLGFVLLLSAITSTWSPVTLFFSGFCFFEAIFSWCAFYQVLGRNTCPA